MLRAGRGCNAGQRKLRLQPLQPAARSNHCHCCLPALQTTHTTTTHHHHTHPIHRTQFKAQVGTDKPIVCTCAHGRRGADAARQLAAAGVQQVVNLEGGLAKWSDEQLPHTGTIKRHH